MLDLFMEPHSCNRDDSQCHHGSQENQEGKLLSNSYSHSVGLAPDPGAVGREILGIYHVLCLPSISLSVFRPVSSCSEICSQRSVHCTICARYADSPRI